MRKYVLIFIGFTIFFSACNSELSRDEKKEILTNLWRIDDVDMGHHILPEKKHVYEQMLEEYRDQSSFEFKADGTYEAILGGVSLETGTWNLSDDETIIITRKYDQTHSDSPDKIHIVELSENKIVLSRKEPDDNVITVYLIPMEESVGPAK